MEVMSIDKTVRNNTVQDLKDLSSESLPTQAKKGEQLVSMMPAFKKSFWFNWWWHSKVIYRKRIFQK